MALDPVTASLIVGGTQAASAIGTNVANALMYKRQRADNRQDAATAYQRSIDMWNMNNAYNDPSAQMERLKQAGLNPNLVYDGNCNFYTELEKSRAWYFAYKTETLLHISDKAVSIFANNPTTENIEDDVTWNVEVTWFQKSPISPVDTPDDIFDCFQLA